MAIEILDFPIKNGGSFHSYVSHYQRVNHNKSIFPQCSCNYWSFSIATLNYQRVVYILCVPNRLKGPAWPGMALLGCFLDPARSCPWVRSIRGWWQARNWWLQGFKLGWIWVWINTYRYIFLLINTIFNGMNIHKSQLFWCSLGTRVLTHPHMSWKLWMGQSQCHKQLPEMGMVYRNHENGDDLGMVYEIGWILHSQAYAMFHQMILTYNLNQYLRHHRLFK